MNSPMEWYLTYKGTAAISSDEPLDALTAKCWGCHPAKHRKGRVTRKEGAATKDISQRWRQLFLRTSSCENRVVARQLRVKVVQSKRGEQDMQILCTYGPSRMRSPVSMLRQTAPQPFKKGKHNMARRLPRTRAAMHAGQCRLTMYCCCSNVA